MRKQFPNKYKPKEKSLGYYGGPKPYDEKIDPEVADYYSVARSSDDIGGDTGNFGGESLGFEGKSGLLYRDPKKYTKPLSPSRLNQGLPEYLGERRERLNVGLSGLQRRQIDPVDNDYPLLQSSIFFKDKMKFEAAGLIPTGTYIYRGNPYIIPPNKVPPPKTYTDYEDPALYNGGAGSYDIGVGAYSDVNEEPLQYGTHYTDRYGRGGLVNSKR